MTQVPEIVRELLGGAVGVVRVSAVDLSPPGERTFVEDRRRTKLIGRFRGWRRIATTARAVAEIERLRRRHVSEPCQLATTEEAIAA
jgi:hypothetical protein